MTETQKKSLDDLVREELGAEPSQEAKDYARLLYERYRLPEAPATAGEGTAPEEDTATGG
ncbi:hypothetical protein ACOQFV_15695 [Nocardiopsis changdeensis]|uniref:Uncharacterized protein n=1 Tax=Nocardiopsis changdeensis TaxID=2831969 RepID=A0ABX8BHA2_9ACTN|nr:MULTISPECIES: hypothetical protein [Nocardiopsis]QUX21602.1 hypothetical protein KGD84_24870 [Nocardiopsis changdeensis]QYX37537.1 hypothetical protein K1J57_02250 [Nocardiopsis sp. MT53]